MSTSYRYYASMCKRKSANLKSSVADPDPNPGPSEPYVLGLLDLDSLARGTDPDPSIIMQIH